MRHWTDQFQDAGWAYKLGQNSSHFVQEILQKPDAREGLLLVSACGQSIMVPWHYDIYVADPKIKKCGRCARSIKKQPELLGPGAVAGYWDVGTGMTAQHHWLLHDQGFKSRCGKYRDPDDIGIVDPNILADMGVDHKRDLLQCKKCSNYLGIDMANNVPGKQVIKDHQGDLISVELVQAKLTEAQLGKVVTGGRVLADPVEAWIAIDDELGLLDCSVSVEQPGPFIEGFFTHHLQKRLIVIIGETK